jgi:hypothetical protein
MAGRSFYVAAWICIGVVRFADREHIVRGNLVSEADACKASGLLALKQRFPQVKDVLIDLDSAKIIKADTTIENVPIKTVVIGDAYVERTKTTKPQTLVCVIGDKGKVLLTLFSDK